MRIGFTGTQLGMTRAQREEVRSLLSQFHVSALHLGDCIGADADCHQIGVELGHNVILVGHPPHSDSKRAFLKYGISLPPKPYLDRNKDIVNESEMLIATPKGNKEELRSGTWSTVRYARKCGKRVYIVYPDGRIEALID
jgi:hypothetical protein